MASIVINGGVETGSAALGNASDPAPPLVVEFDGTCVKTNLLLEFLLALLKQKPQYLLLVPFWLVRGKAYLAQRVARQACVDVSLLPYRIEFLEYLKGQRKNGRSIILSTETDLQITQQIAEYLMLFATSLPGERPVTLLAKSQLRSMVQSLGERGFDYATSGNPDLAVASSARKVILVHPSRKARLAIPKLVSVERVFDGQRRRFRDYLTPLRPQHWIKNLLAFVPVLAAHRFYEISLFERSLVAFVGLCCLASAGYLFNDLIDLAADRHHPLKRLRPFAAGELPLSYGLIAIPCLIGLGCAAGAWLSPLSVAMLLSYFVLTMAYTLYIKRIVLLDVIVLAGLYTLRIIVGSAAVWIWPSPWLLGFSMFLFLSLALVKRYSELVIMRKVDGDMAKARSYELGDAELLAAKGTASGYLSVLVLALYITSGPAGTLYGRHQLMWFLCPLLLYWIGRMWLSAHRGTMNDDPVLFAATDPISRILLLLMMGIIVLAL